MKEDCGNVVKKLKYDIVQYIMTNESNQPSLFDSEPGSPENTPKIVPPSEEFDLAHPDTPVDTKKREPRDPNKRNAINAGRIGIGGGIVTALGGKIDKNN